MHLAESREDLPDAVVAANDQVAIGVLRSFTEAGVRVPEQVAVVGFDDIYHGVACEPPLTTVHQPMRLLGERACARLLERIAAPGLPHRVDRLPTELVLRRSCGCTQSASSTVLSNAGTLRPLRPLCGPSCPPKAPPTAGEEAHTRARGHPTTFSFIRTPQRAAGARSRTGSQQPQPRGHYQPLSQQLNDPVGTP